MGCGGCSNIQNRVQKGPPIILYDHAIVSVTADNVLSFPNTQASDKDFLKSVSTRLAELTKTEIASVGKMGEVAECGPKTMKIIQEITGVKIDTVTYHQGKFFVAQIFTPGSGTSTKNDIFYIDTITKLVDCETGKTLDTYNHHDDGPNILDVLKNVALSSVYFACDHQKGWRSAAESVPAK